MTEQLYLMLAAAELGDHEGIRLLYQALVKEKGERIGSAARVKAGADQDEILSATALAGALAAKLGEPEAAAFAEYLSDNPTTEVLVQLEQLLLAEAALPRIYNEPVSFLYAVDGKEERRELKAGEVFRLAVRAAALDSLLFRSVNGKIGLTVAYDGPVEAAEVKRQEGFRVARRYEVEGKSTDSLKAGDLVRIVVEYTIPETAPGGAYEISDYLPAGLRLVQRPWQYGQKMNVDKYLSWPIEVNGQKVSFYAGKNSVSTITYYARVAAPGTYSAEQMVLQHQKSGLIYGHGSREQVKIAW